VEGRDSSDPLKNGYTSLFTIKQIMSVKYKFCPFNKKETTFKTYVSALKG
jgi:hypothetical protein